MTSLGNDEAAPKVVDRQSRQCVRPLGAVLRCRVRALDEVNKFARGEIGINYVPGLVTPEEMEYSEIAVCFYALIAGVRGNVPGRKPMSCKFVSFHRVLGRTYTTIVSCDVFGFLLLSSF